MSRATPLLHALSQVPSQAPYGILLPLIGAAAPSARSLSLPTTFNVCSRWQPTLPCPRIPRLRRSRRAPRNVLQALFVHSPSPARTAPLLPRIGFVQPAV